MPQPKHILRGTAYENEYDLLNENLRELSDQMTLANFAGGEINTGTVVVNNTYIEAPIITADGSQVDGAHIIADTITGDQILANSITATEIDTDTIDTLNLTAGSIVVGDDTNKLWLNDSNDGGLAVGGTDKSTAPMRIEADGRLTATDIVATGTINAQDGYLSSGVFINSTDTILCEDSGLNVGTEGHIRGGQTDYDTGTGFFIGRNAGAYKLSLGDAINSLTWDGSSLRIKGKLNTDSQINLKTYTTGGLPGVGVDSTAKSPSANYNPSSATVDSYAGDAGVIYVGGVGSMVAQSFTNTDRATLDSCKFGLVKQDATATTGTIYARIYAHSGTYGTSSVPTGSPLATSDTLDASTIGWSGTPQVVDYTFKFSGSNKIDLSASTYYCVAIVMNCSGGAVSVNSDNVGATHSGNQSSYITSWTASSAGRDTNFAVYSVPPLTNPDRAYSSNDSYATCTPDSGKISIQISKDAGANWSTAKSMTYVNSEVYQAYGSSTDYWGIPLTGADLNSTTDFIVRVICGTSTLYQQEYRNFGFSYGGTETVLGLTISVEAKYNAGTTSVDHVKIVATTGSTFAVQEGSLAYDSTVDALVSHNGTSWVPTNQTDTIVEKTAANGVTVDGLNIKDGKLNTNSSVIGSNLNLGYATYNGYLTSNQTVTTTADVTNATCSITTTGGKILVIASLPIYCQTTTATGTISVNGVSYNLGITNATSYSGPTVMTKVVTGLAAGTYVVKLRAGGQSGNNGYVAAYKTISIEAIEI